VPGTDRQGLDIMALRALVVWGGLLAAAILNGALREKWLVPRIGERIGHWVSTLILCTVILLIGRLTTAWIHPASTKDSIVIGSSWVLLTVAFEFLAGHFLFGNPWSHLLADYNLAQGRIWILVPITLMLSPLVVRV
jgi:hypothetical protein